MLVEIIVMSILIGIGIGTVVSLILGYFQNKR